MVSVDTFVYARREAFARKMENNRRTV